MPRQTALTAKGLSPAERKAHVAALVASGELTPAQARLIDFREPTAAVRAFGKTLEGKARECLSRNRRAAA